MKTYCLECNNELYPPHYVEGQFQHEGSLCDECREQRGEKQEENWIDMNRGIIFDWIANCYENSEERSDSDCKLCSHKEACTSIWNIVKYLYMDREK